MFKLAADPKRWISVTAPLLTSAAFSPACWSKTRVSTRCTTCSTGVSSLGCAASSRRSGIGSESTRWRTGTWGMTGGERGYRGVATFPQHFDSLPARLHYLTRSRPEDQHCTFPIKRLTRPDGMSIPIGDGPQLRRPLCGGPPGCGDVVLVMQVLRHSWTRNGRGT